MTFEGLGICLLPAPLQDFFSSDFFGFLPDKKKDYQGLNPRWELREF